MPDPAFEEVEWHMELRGLTDQERCALEGLFEEAEGRLGSFTFLDPMGNLLAWSEELWREAWTRGPHLELSSEVSDPLGGTRATSCRNNGPVAETVEQALGVPGWFQYCLSVWLRSGGTSEVTLFARASAAAQARTVAVGRLWQRVAIPLKLDSVDELVRFGVELGPGVSVELFGIQVEAQGGASQYKRTRAQGGVYTEARFDQDSLAVKAQGPGAYACAVRVVARL